MRLHVLLCLFGFSRCDLVLVPLAVFLRLGHVFVEVHDKIVVTHELEVFVTPGCEALVEGELRQVECLFSRQNPDPRLHVVHDLFEVAHI